MNRRWTTIGASLAWAASSLLATANALADTPPDIALYTAQYKVEYKGRNMGESEFSVAHDTERDLFTFNSHTRVKGLARLISPQPVVEHSEFNVVSGQIKPLNFRYEDGSRKGEDNYTADFDWAAGEVRIAAEQGPKVLALTNGVLDRGSLQVAVMNDAAAGRVPGPYTLADEDSLNNYEFTAEDDAQIETAMGTFTAQRVRQQRQGSSRHTILWLVPELRYLPVLIEQYREGEVHTAFIVESVQWR